MMRKYNTQISTTVITKLNQLCGSENDDYSYSNNSNLAASEQCQYRNHQHDFTCNNPIRTGTGDYKFYTR
jgi:hypothetical protein